MHFTKFGTNIEIATLASLWAHDGMTRRALGTELGLSRPTIERALRSLTNKELIASSELNTPNRGRPATVFQVRENAWLTLGMDFELPEVNLVLANTVGTILHQKQFEVRQDLNDPRRVLGRLADTIRVWLDGLDDGPCSVEDIAGLGIGVPGFFTPNGVSFVGRNLPMLGAGRYPITITVYAGDDYEYVSYQVTIVSVGGEEQTGLLYIIIFSAIGIVSSLSAYTVAYQKVLKYPKPVRKIRKIKSKLMKKKRIEV